MRERETQELLKTGQLSSDRKKTSKLTLGKGVNYNKVGHAENDWGVNYEKCVPRSFFDLGMSSTETGSGVG